MNSEIIVDNIKCGGCANTVDKELKLLGNIDSVNVNLETGSIQLEHTDLLNLELVKKKLRSLGYPEKGSLEGFSKLGAEAKSYVSCAIGKMT